MTKQKIVWVDEATREKIKSLKRGQETIESVIRRLIDFYEKEA